MNTDTFEIESMADVMKKSLQEQSKYVEIPPQFQHLLEGMNRSQRRKWYKKNKHLFKKEDKVDHFQRYHKEDTSHESKEEAVKLAKEVIDTAEGFMLFTVQKGEGNQLAYRGNAFITADHAAGMPEFIRKVLDQRKDEIDGKSK